MTFTAPLEYEVLSGQKRRGRQLVKLVRPLDYGVGTRHSALRVFVEAGFITDLASIPAPLLRWFPADGKWAAAAVLHDRLYAGAEFSRLIADAIFLEALGVLKVPLALRMAMFGAVRALGWRSWGLAEQDLAALETDPDWHLSEDGRWLAVNHSGRIGWDELQALKNAAMGRGARAVEVYPAEEDVVNRGTVRHLWRVPETMALPDLKAVSAGGRR